MHANANIITQKTKMKLHTTRGGQRIQIRLQQKNHKGCINNLSQNFLVVYFLTSQALPFKTKQRILLKKNFPNSYFAN